MKFLPLSICLLLFSITSVFAQRGTAVITGTVSDSSNSPLIGATVVINNLSGKTITGARCDSKGHFTIIDVAEGEWNFQARSIGYIPFNKRIQTKNNDTIRLGTLRLKSSSVTTDEVEVTARALRVEMKGDTIDYNASQFKTDKNAAAEDLIRKLPGLEVENGQVKAQGEQVKKILVDGKPFFGNDPTAAMKNLPSEVIDRVQVYDQMSDQSQFTRFDDGERNKTLNIITKQDHRNGQFGKIYAGYGDQDRYTAGGNLNIFGGDRRISILGLSNNINQQNFSIDDILGATGGGGMMGKMMSTNMKTFGGNLGGGRGGRMFSGGGGIGDFLVNQSDGVTASHGLGVNYSDQWGKGVDITGSYFVNYSDNDALQKVNRQSFISDTLTQLSNQITSGTSKNLNHRINMRADIAIDSMNSILITPRMTLQTNDRTALGSTNTSANTIPVNTSLTNNTNNSNGYNIGSDVLYRLRFPTEGRTLSVGAKFNTRDNSSDQNNISENTYFFEGDTINNTLRQTIPSVSKEQSYGGNMNYTEQFAKNHQLQLSYNGNITHSTSDRKTYSEDTSMQTVPLLNKNLSNISTSDYTTHRPGISYRFSIVPEADTSHKQHAGGVSTTTMFGSGGGRGGNERMRNMMGGAVGTWTFNLGADYQMANLKVNQTYPTEFGNERTFTNVLPSVSVSVRPSPVSNFRFNYRTSTNQPSISQLQNVVDNTDPLRISIGNPALDQEYTHTIYANYGTFNLMSASAFFTMVNLNFTQSRIITSTFIASRDTVFQNPFTGTPVALGTGAQFSRPVNVNGYWNANTFFMYSTPVEPLSGLKLNLNTNVGVNYTHDLGLINDIENIANTVIVTPAIGVSSNISEYTDFSLSARTAYNTVSNSVRQDLNSNYYIHTITARTSLISHDTSAWIDGWALSGDFSYSLTTGLSSSEYNKGIPLLNLGVGKRLFDGRGELKLSVFDLLNQNNSINRNVGSGYIEDVQTNVLQRYVMLSFTYNLRAF